MGEIYKTITGGENYHKLSLVANGGKRVGNTLDSLVLLAAPFVDIHTTD